MRVNQQPAFILHGRAWRETSMLLECFTCEHGRIGLVARGVRKERSRTPRALLQPLTPVSVGWSGAGELATLTGIEPRGQALALAGEGLLCGLYLNELVLRLTVRQDPHPELFAAYTQALERLAAGDLPAWSLRRFERDALGHLGYGLDLSVDALTGTPLDEQGTYGYRHEAGPVTWRGVADGPPVSGAALLALAADRRPDEGELAPLRRWLRGVIAAHLDGGELQAWKLLAGAQRQDR